MQSGRLRHIIDIQYQGVVQDEVTGNITDTWPALATGIRAEIRPATVKEFIGAGVEASKISAVVTIRYLAGIKPSMRIIHGERTYNIEGVLPDPKSGIEYLVLPVSEVISG